MMMKQLTGFVLTVVLLAGVIWLAIVMRPTCREGHVAVLTKYNGWVCLAGEGGR